MHKVFFAFAYEYDKSNPWYRLCLKNTVKDAGCQAVFADEVANAGHILDHIEHCIDEAAIGFYDVTGLNPNVLIEYGIGHASDKPSFLLINHEAHLEEIKTFWGKKATPLPIPADLNGILQHQYNSSQTLAVAVRRVITQTLIEPKQGMALANQVIERLKRRGPGNMSGIAKDMNKPIDEVRPILKSLVATDQVIKEGHSRGTTYRLPQ
ncbi:MAG: hypothetical protein ABMA00_00080 [Gemmatimonas sp.]